MLPAIVGGLISGGLGLLGASMTNDANSAIAADTNRQSAEQAALNRDFQERMSNTSYQRGVADLQAAGLNPMLVYTQAGASQPQGSMASMQGYSAQNEIASAVEGYQGSMQREILKQQAINMEKEGKLTDEKVKTQEELTEATKAQAARDSSQSMLSDSQYALNEQQRAKEHANRPYWEKNFAQQSDKLVQEVKELIQRIKTGTASAGQYKAMTDKIRQDIKFHGYDEQRLKNLSEAEKSAIKSKLSPYLPELKLLLQSLP